MNGSGTVAFAYPGARIQARFGQLVPAAQWQRLTRVPGFGAFLQQARESPLRPWVLQLDPAADGHRIESHLRAAFRRTVAALAAWAPSPWRPAVAWVDVLPDLPALAHRARGGEGPAWMTADARLARLAPGGAAALPPELRELVTAAAGRRPLAELWLERWRSLWPAAPPQERRALEQLAALATGAVTAAARDAPDAIARLREPLRRLFRRHTRAPAGLFAYLALAWLDVMDLRGALLRRRFGLPLEGEAA